jgi:chorismate mutase/prephenate dehydratase
MSQPQQSEDLGALRIQIDSLDQQLLSMLNQRALVAEKVGALKRIEGSPFFRPDRVAQVIEKIQNANQGPLLNQHVASIWREIMSACLALEAPQRVAVLGPQGTFCEQAAIEFFGSAADLIYCANFDEVFHATAAGTAQFGVVGMENSTEGVVARSLDLFLRSPVHVVGEVSLLVRHNLLRQTNTLAGVDVVLAHPQALAQCQGWLSQHLPNAERRAVSSNAEGARLCASNPTWASLASERAAAQFGPRDSGRGLQPHPLCRHLPAANPGHASGVSQRLHQSDCLGAESPRRRARPAGAAEKQWRLYDPV